MIIDTRYLRYPLPRSYSTAPQFRQYVARYRQADVPLHGTTARYKKGKAAARQQQDKVDQFCEFQVNIYIPIATT